MKIAEALDAVDHPAYKLFDKYESVFDYFDDWVVVRATEDGYVVREIVLKKKGKPHLETVFWDEQEWSQ